MPANAAARHVVTAVRRASTRVPPPPAARNTPQRAPPSQSEATTNPWPKYKSPRIQAPPTFAKSRAVPWVLMSIMSGAMAFYGTLLYLEIRKPVLQPEMADLKYQKDVSSKYDETADGYDSEVNVSESLMGVTRLRKRLARQCTGHVLEASCGTGRNLGYFDVGLNGTVESLTFVDLSPQMVDICKRKWLALHRKDDKKLKPGLPIRFLTGSAIEQMPPAPTKAKYDTIIQTMGLCSTPSPSELLANLVKHLDTSNPDARILLLEHGRSYQQWLNRILDNAAFKHAEIHGCWFNRDIGAIVEEAAQSNGMEIVNERRHHLGTTWMFELKPIFKAEHTTRTSLP